MTVAAPVVPCWVPCYPQMFAVDSHTRRVTVESVVQDTGYVAQAIVYLKYYCENGRLTALNGLTAFNGLPKLLYELPAIL